MSWQASQAERSACEDCGHDTHMIGEYYMLHDDVWAKALDAGWCFMLCIGCVERRLGRRLHAGDFTDAPINGSVFKCSLRMRHRLQRIPDASELAA